MFVSKLRMLAHKHTSPQKHGSSGSARQDRRVGLLAFSPLVAVVGLLAVFPIGWIVVKSFTSQQLLAESADFVALKNYGAVIARDNLGAAAMRSISFATGSLLLQVPIAMGIAMMLNTRFFLRDFSRSALLFGFIVPYVVVALSFRFMFSASTGILHYWISLLPGNISGNILADPDLAMLGVILVNTWKNFPLLMIVFLAALQTIDPSLYEAADVDGASSWDKFRFISVPRILPIALTIGTLRWIWNFNNFEVIFLLTGGGPLQRTETIPLLLFRLVFGEFSIGRGSALAVITLLVLIAVAIVYRRTYSWAQEQYF